MVQSGQLDLRQNEQSQKMQITELVAKLCAYYHHNAQTKADKQHPSGYVNNESRKMLPLRKLKVYTRLSENVAVVCME
jgi:hypothetical protein